MPGEGVMGEWMRCYRVTDNMFTAYCCMTMLLRAGAWGCWESGQARPSALPSSRRGASGVERRRAG